MNHQLRFKSYELWTTLYKLQATRYELQASRYELWATSFSKIWDINPHLCRLLTVLYVTWAVEWLYGAESYCTFILDSPVPTDLRLLMIVWYRCCSVRSSAGICEISKFIKQRLSFAGFCELTQQVQFNVVKKLKPVFTSLSVVSL
jgi:hypothetical protein